ncbi:MAG: transcription termination factor NusA [Oscillospiraceae bacterium]|nr:transcription termination factor NusA [Oscillospiraceae bacterium]
MSSEFFTAIEEIEKEKGIPRQYMFDKITQAMMAAYRKDCPEAGDNVYIDMNEEKKKIEMYCLYEVVDDITDPLTELTLDMAKNYDKRARVGKQVKVPVDTKRFGRIAAQAAKQVVIQGIREAERGMVYEQFTSNEHAMLTGVVTRINPNSGAVSVKIQSGSEYADAVLPPNEQVKGEVYTEGDHIRVYVIEVRNVGKGPQILLSRTHPGLLKKLFEAEVPEIADGTVEIKSIAREAGSRTKIAVYSNDPDVDPIGSCVGPKGGRVEAIVKELGGEKIDIIKYSENIEEYVAMSLAPSEVLSVEQLDELKLCRVIVPDSQLSLAIGKEGQNARLAAKLTGCKIDIKPLSEASIAVISEE